MCLLVLAWRSHARYCLVVAANRDEYHDRPAAPLGKWPAPAELLAGRDLRAQGTWLGVDCERRFGVVTNFRELQRTRAGAPSRGELVPLYLTARALAARGGAAEFFTALAERAQQYSGFNLLLTDETSLWYGSNRATPFARKLPPGVYGLSNELLDTPWPKLQRVRAGFESWLRVPQASGTDELFALLADRTPAEDILPPHEGGLPREWQRALSAPFVLHPEYGTRCSTVLLLAPDGTLDLIERRFDAHGKMTGETAFHLRDADWP
ncbi:MAG: NRDE family protein [Gammaproteobacteria bacterium]|nr:NRDE family protein [Gammaproteobacteria bacterium]